MIHESPGQCVRILVLTARFMLALEKQSHLKSVIVAVGVPEVLWPLS